METQDYLLTTAEAAAQLKIHPKHLLRLLAKGRGPKHFKNGRIIRFRQSDLVAFIDAGVAK